MRQKYIRCEMIPTSAGGEQQDYISGRIQLPSDIASGILELLDPKTAAPASGRNHIKT